MWNSQKTLLLVLFTGQQDVKQPTDCSVGAVYWTARCETANRLFCWCCLLVSRMWNSQQTVLLVLFTLANKQEVLLGFQSAVSCAPNSTKSHQIAHNSRLLSAVICSWNCLQHNKQLTCCSTLNAISTSPGIANSWRRTDEYYVGL
jgi:hypothetical protein